MSSLANTLRASPLLQRMLWDAERSADEVPYYPSPKYLRRNWAPEKASRKDIAAVVDAQKRAAKIGALSPELSKALLPNLLTEGRPAQFGVRDFEYPPNPRRDALLRGMGLALEGDVTPPPRPPQGISSDADVAEWGRRMEAQGYRYPDLFPKAGVGYYKDDYAAMDDADYSRTLNARLAAAMLSEKARLYGEDKALERWNGVGSGWAYGPNTQWADAKNHARKVRTLAQMMEHPANQELMKAYLYYGLSE